MTTDKTIRIIFAGGGTGGHLFPAIAIADRITEMLKDKMKIDILFVGTKSGIEYRMKDSITYPQHFINMRGLVRAFTFKNLFLPFIVVGALLNSYNLLNKFKPDIVIGTGGYVCWPVLKVAGWKNIPTLLQEQNSYPGITIRQLAAKAKKIYLGFEKAKQFLNTKAEMIVTGNPVRSDIADGNHNDAINEFKLDAVKKTILILGGSQGARAVNNAVLRSLKTNKLSENYQILWQTGRRDYKDVTVEAGNRVSGCSLFPFSQNMPSVYAAADLVIARAGALTLSEITECGLPAILIPYPYAAGQHQRKNAEDYAARNMAVMIEEKDLLDKDIIKEAVELMENEKYSSIKEAIEAENSGKKKAVDLIAEDIIAQIQGSEK